MHGQVELGCIVVVVVVVVVEVVVVEVVDDVLVLVLVVVVLVLVDETLVSLLKFMRVILGCSVVVVVYVTVVVSLVVYDWLVVVVVGLMGSVTFIMCKTLKQSVSKWKPVGARRENEIDETLGGKIC